jgi:hypothetical protein
VPLPACAGGGKSVLVRAEGEASCAWVYRRCISAGRIVVVGLVVVLAHRVHHALDNWAKARRGVVDADAPVGPCARRGATGVLVGVSARRYTAGVLKGMSARHGAAGVLVGASARRALPVFSKGRVHATALPAFSMVRVHATASPAFS